MKSVILPPKQIEFRITTKCNLSCLPCPFRYKSKISQNELSKEEWLRVIHEAAELGVESCTITGGEAMCKRDVTLSMMRAIKKHGMTGMLITNGTLFDENTIKEIVEMEWDVINFSIDGPNAEINDYIRGAGSFNKAIETIKAFTFWKEKLGKKFPQLNIMPLITNKNYDKIKEMVKLAKELGVSSIYFQKLVVHHSSAKQLELSDEQLKELPKYIEEGREIAKKVGIETNLDSFMQQIKVFDVSLKKEKTFCFFPWCFMGVREDGRVEPCPTDSEDAKSPENVREKSLSEIWNSDYFNQIREKLSNFQYLPRCEKCCPANIFQDKQERRGIVEEKSLMEKSNIPDFQLLIELEAIRKELRELFHLTKKYEGEIEHLKNEKRILEENMQTRIKELQEKMEEIEHLRNEKKALEDEIKNRIEEMKRKEEEMKSKEEKMKKEEEKLRNKIEELEEELDKIHRSLSYRIGKGFHNTSLKIKNFLKKIVV
jgi:radical SAM protein with 4Fe4S-binding SPASM domain